VFARSQVEVVSVDYLSVGSFQADCSRPWKLFRKDGNSGSIEISIWLCWALIPLSGGSLFGEPASVDVTDARQPTSAKMQNIGATRQR